MWVHMCNLTIIYIFKQVHVLWSLFHVYFEGHLIMWCLIRYVWLCNLSEQCLTVASSVDVKRCFVSYPYHTLSILNLLTGITFVSTFWFIVWHWYVLSIKPVKAWIRSMFVIMQKRKMWQMNAKATAQWGKVSLFYAQKHSLSSFG